MSLVKIIEGKEYKDKLNRKRVKRKIIVRCDFCGKHSKEKSYVKKTAEKSLHFCNASCSQIYKFENKKKKKFIIYFCPFCDKAFIRFKSFFRRHLEHTHNIDVEAIEYKELMVECDAKMTTNDIYLKYVLSGKIPLCKCGCGEKVNNFRSGKGYVYGHAIRVHNNWGHNPSALAKSQETRKQMLRDGEIEIWNTGLTKETDERVRLCGEKASQLFTDERKQRYSNTMKRNRLDGTIPTLYGPDHSQWKGGTSGITAMIYANNTLYKQWKFPILKRDNFTCTSCGSTENLHVHHDDITMSQILHEYKDAFQDYDHEDFTHKKQIAEQVVSHHVNNNIPGITLCKSCHKEHHNNLNF